MFSDISYQQFYGLFDLLLQIIIFPTWMLLILHMTSIFLYYLSITYKFPYRLTVPRMSHLMR